MNIKFLSISADNGVTMEFRLPQDANSEEGKPEVKPEARCYLPHSDTRYFPGDVTNKLLSQSLNAFVLMMQEAGKKDKTRQKEIKRATSNGKRPMLELE